MSWQGSLIVDMKVFKKEGGLMEKIPGGTKAVSDEGYGGAADKVSTRNTFDTKEVKRFKNRVKARHETFNAQLKRFGILEQAFCSTGTTRLEKHKAAFEACCVIVQYDFDNGSTLFRV